MGERPWDPNKIEIAFVFRYHDRIERRQDILGSDITERGITIWAEAEVHTAAEVIPAADLSEDVPAEDSEADGVRAEVPAVRGLAVPASEVRRREVRTSEDPLSAPILEVPAGDGEVRSSPEADGEVPEEGADSVVPQ